MCAVYNRDNETLEQWVEFEETLMWTFRYMSILDKITQDECQRLAKMKFHELFGRHPHYGTELFRFVNTTRKVAREFDAWVPDAFEIWQEEQFNMEMEGVLDDLALMENDVARNSKAKPERDPFQEWSRDQKKKRFSKYDSVFQSKSFMPKAPLQRAKPVPADLAEELENDKLDLNATCHGAFKGLDIVNDDDQCLSCGA